MIRASAACPPAGWLWLSACGRTTHRGPSDLTTFIVASPQSADFEKTVLATARPAGHAILISDSLACEGVGDTGRWAPAPICADPAMKGPIVIARVSWGGERCLAKERDAVAVGLRGASSPHHSRCLGPARINTVELGQGKFGVRANISELAALSAWW